MKYSMRGNVDPFIVMDVMENARKAEEKYRIALNLNKDSGLEKIIKSKIKNISK